MNESSAGKGDKSRTKKFLKYQKNYASINWNRKKRNKKAVRIATVEGGDPDLDANGSICW